MGILTAILNALTVLICLFLICLVLIQRGKGGGLAGAFGGVGGSSAFGTKSGDVFTRVTMVVASVWIVLSMLLVVLYNQGGQSAWGDDERSAVSKEVTPKSGDTSSSPSSAAPSGTGSAAPASSSPTSSAPASSSSSSAPVSVPAIPDTPADKAK